jgi:superoxide dismutase, Cu-Zn family
MPAIDRWIGTGLALLVVLATAGCPPPGTPEEELPDEAMQVDPPVEAEALLHDARGDQVGSITFSSGPAGGIHIRGWVDLPELGEGRRGFHVHETGRCDAPDFETAGDHFNPDDSPHGGPNDPPEERHAGDLGNLQLDPDGRIEVERTDLHLDLEGIVGRSVVVHEDEDDLETDPDGNAGDRVACGVIQP